MMHIIGPHTTYEVKIGLSDLKLNGSSVAVHSTPSSVLFEIPSRADLQTTPRDVPAHNEEVLTNFLVRLYSVYVALHSAYLEIKSLVVLDHFADGPIHYLDMAAKLNQTAEGICCPKWAVARDLTVYETAPVAPTIGFKVNVNCGPPVVWPAPFSRDFTKEEGSASVVYSDAIAAARFTHELANYGEYSGAPSEGQTFEYGKTIYTGIVKMLRH
ncbi:hypothetical protein EV424DRAFT_1627827 [Suillus variegatus]|nr:hypothetical protein EV424DRAFT_1627827 [Suillus variegatus]